VSDPVPPSLPHLELRDPEQIRAFAHPTRQRILQLLARTASTNKEIAEVLNEPAPRVHHHVRALVDAGLIELVRTAPKGGVIEKYYGARARSYSLVATYGDPAGETAIATSALQAAVADHSAASRRGGATVRLDVMHDRVRLSTEARRRLDDLLDALRSLVSEDAATTAGPETSVLVLIHDLEGGSDTT
jgi:DNA-binding transcriptional ArsR family regulator